MLRLACCLLVSSLLSVQASAASFIYSPPNAMQKTAFIRVEGAIGVGDSKKLLQTIRDAQKSGKTIGVTLASNGGDLQEALALGRIIRQYKADTFHEYCAAECVLTFLAGDRRLLNTLDSTAGLIVNRPKIGDEFITLPTRELKQQLDGVRDYIYDMTGAVLFYTRMMSIPYSTPHTLKPETALELKVVTHVLRE